ncbi:methylated-DNA--[protein]-cysteine S-methyltransferase [Thermomonospora umbrina]|uniref:methylated-DNA--[protein]-cysteine S-methyltransferase n=1 Tax=Thermomonospora umbrina TaxID=111806 RepID=A0A3D9SGU5_9ACTN|nr:methylated-DNA--[protein]-cysteine S-methyltransferase [Thermomonospora umbrina]REE95126.1 methylated-DNA-[protein]-cysteine S-methyltransferase [Thermomonospora umbrina]
MGETVAFGAVGTPLGRMLVAMTEVGVVSLDFHDSPEARRAVAERAGLPVVEDPVRTAAALEGLAGYFAGGLREFGLPVDWRLTSRVQRQVLDTLYASVPYGRVLTYGELGERSGIGVPARAIGQVMGANPIPVIVPCHRIVAGNGLGGYSGGSGVEIKRWLLTLEGALPATFDWDPEQGP